MKILSIHIKNLASIESEFVIDFTKEPLLSAGIFAITGPTGAGKSTILDAICLALYARTPRHAQAKEIGIEIADVGQEKIKPHDVKSILRKGTAEGSAGVKFIGSDGHKYFAQWNVKRAHNKVTGALQQDTTSLLNLDEQKRFPGKNTETLKEIERLVGLNFDQFTRSVLLAQGDFTAFLKAEKKEKSALLEKLTGTGIYSEISRRIYQKSKESDLAVKNKEELLAGIDLLSEEDLTRTKTAEQDAAATLVKLTEKHAQLKKDKEWHIRKAELQQHLAEEHQKLAVAQNTLSEYSPKIEIHQRILSIQDARAMWTEKERSTKELDSKIRQLSNLTTEETTLKADALLAHDRYEAATVALNEKETETARLTPEIEKALQLDALIGEKSAQLLGAESEFGEAKKALESQTINLAAQQLTVDNLAAEIEKHEAWKNKNIAKQPIAENHGLIESLLLDAGNIVAGTGILRNHFETAIAQEKKLNHKVGVSQHETEIQCAELQRLGAQKTLLESQLMAVDAGSLAAKSAEYGNKLIRIATARGQWSLLWHAIKETDAALAKINEIERDLTEFRQRAEGLKPAVAEAEAKKEVTSDLLNKARLETAADVVSLRDTLEKDKACPVCGSTAHPYAAHAPELSLLATIEAEFKNWRNRCEQLAKEESEVLNRLNGLERQRDEENLRIGKSEKECTALAATLEGYDLVAMGMPVDFGKRSQWFDDHESRLQAEQKSTNDALAEYEDKRTALGGIQTAISDKEKKLSAQQSQLQKEQFELQTNAREAAQIQEQITTATERLNELMTALGNWFGGNDWQTNWRKDPDAFTKKVADFALEWKERKVALEHCEGLAGIEKTKLAEMRSYETVLKQNTAQKESSVVALQKEQEDLTTRRSSLLGGRTVKAVTETLGEQTAVLKQSKNAAEIAYRGLSNELGRIAGAVGAARNEIAKAERDLSDATLAIKTYLEQYPKIHQKAITEAEVSSLLAVPPAELDTEQKKIGDLRDAVVKTRASADKVSELIARHISGGGPQVAWAETLKALSEAETDIETQTKLLQDLQFSLLKQVENELKSGNIARELKSLRQTQEQRQKLNELIGSADGEKFRQIAQEYTLDYLLSYANMHLGSLTSRYRLGRIPDTLALQVTDVDMGNELRSVFSLSGGESFLVSLALALGLASLSANRMSVESLFIDEGFGTLDEATLITAMEALERLRGQGRKVGVISHVREMTERIRTSIKVTRLSSGKSKIEIVG